MFGTGLKKKLLHHPETIITFFPQNYLFGQLCLFFGVKQIMPKIMRGWVLKVCLRA